LEAHEFVERPAGSIPTEMIEVAEGIISRRQLAADANALHDRYEDRVRSLIEEKTGGSAGLPPRPAAGSVQPPPTPAPAPTPAAASPSPDPVTTAATTSASSSGSSSPAASMAASPPPTPEPAASTASSAAASAAAAAAATSTWPRTQPEAETARSTSVGEREDEGTTSWGAASAETTAAASEASSEAEPAQEGSVLAGEPDGAHEETSGTADAAEAEAEPEPEPEREVETAAHSEAEKSEPEPEPVAVAAATAAAEETPPLYTDAQRTTHERNLLGDGAQARELGTEILLHIMGLGDRRYVEPGWAGHPGSRRQIEAMSIRPREELEPSALEFRVFAQEGRATAWVSNGNYAGTRGRQLPLTGFAVRPSPDLRDKFDIVYEGCFFDGGVVGPRRNGEICTSPVANDPLEAVRVTIVERS